MRSETMDIFIEDMGEPTTFQPVPEEAFRRYRGILPDVLLEYWQDIGWSGFADGRFWVTNPEEYDHLAEMWLQDTPFEQLDRYHVIARTAFGELYLWGERTHQKFTLCCPLHGIIALEQEVKSVDPNKNAAIKAFFLMASKKKFDIEAEDDQMLFEQALKKLGPLKPDEVYGFEPAIVAGGRIRLSHLARLNMDIHLTILRQMAAPSVPFAGVDVKID